MKLKRRKPTRGRIEMIPMVDTILILLIFYMSFSSFKITEKRIDAKMPLLRKVAATAVTQVPLDFTLHVYNKNRIIVNTNGLQKRTKVSPLGFAEIGGYRIHLSLH